MHDTKAIRRRSVALVFVAALIGAATILATASAGTRRARSAART